MFNSRMALSIIAIISVTSLFAPALLADSPKHKGKPDKTSKEARSDGYSFNVDASLSVMVTAGVSVEEARKLARGHQLTGSKPLPPGIRKNLARGKPMPPGIQRTRMPDSFINQLPGREGFEWQQAGTDLVLVVSGSLVISDVVKGVFD